MGIGYSFQHHPPDVLVKSMRDQYSETFVFLMSDPRSQRDLALEDGGAELTPGTRRRLRNGPWKKERK